MKILGIFLGIITIAFGSVIHHYATLPVTQQQLYTSAIPISASHQYHAQDLLGQYSYGYSGGSSSKNEIKTLDGVTRGAYSYVDSNGKIQTVQYTADSLNGFRVAATNLPVGPTEDKIPPEPVQDTPEVAQAKIEHLNALHEAEIRAALTPDSEDDAHLSNDDSIVQNGNNGDLSGVIQKTPADTTELLSQIGLRPIRIPATSNVHVTYPLHTSYSLSLSGPSISYANSYTHKLLPTATTQSYYINSGTRLVNEGTSNGETSNGVLLNGDNGILLNGGGDHGVLLSANGVHVNGNNGIHLNENNGLILNGNGGVNGNRILLNGNNGVNVNELLLSGHNGVNVNRILLNENNEVNGNGLVLNGNNGVLLNENNNGNDNTNMWK